MRELINIIESYSIINEKSRGLLYREKGDRFFKGDRNNPTEALIFDNVQYFPGQPPSKPGAYESSEEMFTAYQELEKQIGNITPVNQHNKSTKAFALLTLIDETTKQPVYYARFFQQIFPDMAGAWKNSDLDNYQLDKKTSLKASYKLKPSDLFPGNARFSSIGALWDTLQNSSAASPYLPGLSMLFESNPEFPIFAGMGDQETAIRDDLGEIIGPIALIQNMDMGTGAKAADKDLNDSRGWGGSSLSFPSGKTNGLVDSYFTTPSGVEIGVSSKGESGATASVKNIADGITYVRTKGSPDQKKLLNTYKDQIEVIDAIGTAGSIDFPINYGIEYGLISPEAADYIRQLIKYGAKSLEEYPSDDDNVTNEVQALIDAKGADTSRSNYNVGFHALASLAREVANTINSDPKFGEACLKFLNSSPIIQLHMYVKKLKDDSVEVTKFISKYPPNFQGTVGLDPSKNYSSTMAGGRMSFAYHGKDAGFKDDETNEPAPVVSKAKFTATAADIINPKRKSEKEKSKVGGVGRELRSRKAK
jgi:hypothetical protein